MRSTRTLISSLVLLLAVQSAAAADQWLHVRVDEGGRHGEKVNVNIPLGMVESILPLIAVDELQHGKIRIDADEIEGIDLSEVLTALRDGPDANFVTVQSEDETVRVAKEDGFIIVNVDERGRSGGDRVRIKMPLSVVEALVGGERNELDLLAAIRELGRFQGEDLVRVESDDSTVRVWIDSSEDGS